ncbi:unnamed protein product [Ilex paraguariensis]|uniref:Uncharacterized protein n=1 Tax=Ilex paraguariensis TaxID=185542 RepID=A0ABC8RA04_9AQUA
MGGGGAWRLGAKIAGVSVANSGLRSVTAEHQVSAAARQVTTRPVSAVVTSSNDVNSSVSVTTHSGKIDEEIQMPYWLDDWEFASIDESGEPRLVFGGAPTFQEAKEVTSELNDALKEVYLAPPHSIGCSGSYIDGQDSCLPLFSESEVSESKKCVTSETHSVSQNAIGAFGFLNRSHAAQVLS